GAWCRSLNVWKHYLIIITMHIQFFYPFFQCVKIKIRVELSGLDHTPCGIIMNKSQNQNGVRHDVGK
ncbi:hypothetical protein, partial [Legionella sp.]|uniref:hypothetical protein n=1 Tax=Legionella sp. TaxID=459 RepID=UPI003CB4C3EA